MRERHIHAAWDCIKKGNFGWLARQGLKFLAIPLSQKLDRPLCGPIEGIITPTFRCNSDCLMCDIKRRGDKGKELGREQWIKIIDEMHALGVSGIGISGGEPLLSRDTPDLVAHISRLGLPVHISSNGFLVTADLVRRLIDAGLTTIAISIDSADPATNDRLRGIAGAFEMAVKAVGTIAQVRRERNESNLRLSIATVISRQSMDSALGVIDLAEQAGADTVSFLPVMTSGLTIDKEERSSVLTFTEEAMDRAETLIRTLHDMKKGGKVDNSDAYIDALRSYFLGEPFPATCYAGYAIVVVGAHGEVYPCFDFLERDIAVGNVQRHSLTEVWRSGEYAEMRHRLAQCRDCYLACHQEFNLMYRILDRRALAADKVVENSRSHERNREGKA